jgi:6-phosphofructo-2-kinase/fructose-2,6-biphosphatase
VNFLLNSRLAFRPVFLCRHGMSADNVAGRIGGDSQLSPPGVIFSESLRAFIAALPPHQRPSAVWTSTLRRTVQSAAPLRGMLPQVQWRALDEIDAGVCEGMTYADVLAQLPAEAEARKTDKLRYRYPRGESYLDVIQRLEPVIIELERQHSPVLIIAHQAVLRCLTAYFTNRRAADVPHISLPLHTVIQLTPSSYGIKEEQHVLHPGPSAA